MPLFGDFLVEPNHSGPNNPWFFDVATAKKSLALGCFTVLQKHLRFNICHFPDSHLLNSEVPGLTECHLSPALIYASRFWGPHLGDSDFHNEILVSLKSFLTGQFLFWLEVLSIRQEVAFAAGILQFAQNIRWEETIGLKCSSRMHRNLFQCLHPPLFKCAAHLHLGSPPGTEAISSTSTLHIVVPLSASVQCA
ncbi:hypothetical protein B0H14DRAFT_2485505 [Mycena olivaceomarginata]|nr:hypothetical protein B0H14DRAFT_2485505 [Mycena olivaceomarginata]